MIRNDVVTDTRLSGMVSRYHTWPTLTQQSTGEHSWQVLRIFIEIFGLVPSAVSEFILYHDSEELIIGDPPFPMKADNPTLKSEYDRLGDEAIRRMRGRAMPDLGSFDRVRVKVCDLLEMFEFGLHEQMLGNRYAQPIIEDTLAAALLLTDRLPEDDAARVRQYIKNRKEKYQ